MRGVWVAAMVYVSGACGCGAIPMRPEPIVTTQASAGAVTYLIAYPAVAQPLTSYPAIAFQPGDRIAITATGCVQTGGLGKTWKRYVNPVGAKADELYSATIAIDGITRGTQRLQPWLERELIATRPAVLQLGYQDTGYSDNGYDHRDDGVDDQCRDAGPAAVELTVRPGPAGGEVALPRYNEVYQHSTHNAYEGSKPGLPDKLETYHIHSLEIDIHTRKGPHDAAPAGDWYVFHEWLPTMKDSNCNKLSDCLSALVAWHDRHPRHDVVTLFIDLKDAWSPGHQPAELDARFSAMLAGSLWAPSALTTGCGATLRTALARCGWPDLLALRGKFIVVLTGSTEQLTQYQRDGAAGFVAPEIAAASEIAASPRAIFFNLNTDHFTVGRDVMALGFVSRVFYRNTALVVHGVNDKHNWDIAVNNSIHHIATDVVRDEGWNTTATPTGWPFACMRRDCDAIQPAPRGTTPAHRSEGIN